MDLNGKVAIVTGGSSGIGAAIVSLSSLSVITNALPFARPAATWFAGER